MEDELVEAKHTAIEANKANLEVFAVIEKPVPLRVVARFLDQALRAAA